MTRICLQVLNDHMFIDLDHVEALSFAYGNSEIIIVHEKQDWVFFSRKIKRV